VSVDLKAAQALRVLKAKNEIGLDAAGWSSIKKKANKISSNSNVDSQPPPTTTAIEEIIDLDTEDKIEVNIPSIVPEDENFDIETFLSTIHGNVTMSQFEEGLSKLHKLLDEQSQEREALVRDHFGLFVKCAEGLEILKTSQQEVSVNLNQEVTSSNGNGTKQPKSATSTEQQSQPDTVEDDKNDKDDENNDEDINPFLDKLNKNKNKNVAKEKLNEAEIQLKKSKNLLDECQELSLITLGPILDKMKVSRKIKELDPMLRKLASSIEYPLLLQQVRLIPPYHFIISSIGLILYS
jgi:hypothetical protein